MNFFDLMRILYETGVWEVVLPFMLVFTIVYATLTTVAQGMFGGSDKKKYAIIVAMVIAFGVVIPHATNSYPPGADVVDIINKSLPNVALIAVAILGVMILVGLFGIELNFSAGSLGFVFFLVCLGLVIYIFGSSAGWGWHLPRWLSFLNHSDTQALLVVMLVFGLVIWFIVREPKEKGKNLEDLKESMGNIKEIFFGKNN